MILQWSLEWLAYQILNRNYFCSRTQSFLDLPCFQTPAKDRVYFGLSWSQIFEIIRIHKHELRKLRHCLPNLCFPSVPFIKLRFQFFLELRWELNHGFYIRKHSIRFNLIDQSCLNEWFFDVISDGDEIFLIVDLSHVQFFEAQVSILSSWCLFIPLG